VPLKSIRIILFMGKIEDRLWIFIYLLVSLWFWTTDSGREAVFESSRHFELNTLGCKGTVMDSR